MKARLLAEFLGTFFLVFAGTGAVVINAFSNGAITHVGISLVFGLVVLAIIYAFGDISGAHLNPAVTIAFAAARRFPWASVAPYIAAQTSGAILASVILRLVFPSVTTLGQTLPAAGLWQSLVLEIIFTFMLMLVILAVSSGSKEKGIMAGVAIGGTVGLLAMFGGPATGASMNPARSLAPALIAGDLAPIWLYILGPITGALLAVPTAQALQIKAQPTSTDPAAPTSSH